VTDLLKENWPEEYDAVREILRRERERGMRRALRVTGWEPRTIDLVVEQEQRFIHDGIDDEA
jgi:hypothetical protein